jgi:hypothetical protein
MKFEIELRPAAHRDLIVAAAGYDAEKPGLGVEFIAEIDRCMLMAAEQLRAFPVFTTTSAASRRVDFHSVSTFGSSEGVSSCSLSSITGATPPSGAEESDEQGLTHHRLS